MARPTSKFSSHPSSDVCHHRPVAAATTLAPNSGFRWSIAPYADPIRPRSLADSSNAQGIIQGNLDVHLNEQGRMEAALLADALNDVPFTEARSSHLTRAFEVGSYREWEMVSAGRATCVGERHWVTGR